MKKNNTIQRRLLREKINDSDTINTLNKININNNINCLEIGMGLGSIAKHLTKYAGNCGCVDAIDLKLENVEYVNNNLSDNILKAYCLDIQDIAKLNKHYDLVHARFVFEHIKEKEKNINIIKNQMNGNGVLIIEDAVYDDVEYNGPLEYKVIIKQYVSCIKNTSPNTDYQWGKNIKKSVEQVGFKVASSFGNIRVFNGNSLEAIYWSKCFKEFQKELIDSGIELKTLDKTFSDLKNEDIVFRL